MATVDVFDLRNQVVGSVDLSDAVFGAPVNENLIYEAVRHYRAGLRSGTAKTKTRHEVSGSGKKLWKQKGTGRARMGSIRSPLWRHGGTVHGPVPRSYAYKLPRKMALGALRSALSAKLRDGELKIVRTFDTGDHKTKSLASGLKTFEAASKVLLVEVIPYLQPGDELTGAERNLALASRNLQGVKLVPSREVTVYDLLAHKQVLLSEAAARKLSEALAV
jgi:large subunit ribosomal protein L4